MRSMPIKSWNYFLIFSALAVVLPAPENISMHLPYFLLCGLGLIPLAHEAAKLVDELIGKVGDRIGSLLNITLGNILELIIAITALNSGLYNLVVIGIAGSVITNTLLILGISTVIAGRKQLNIELQAHSRALSTNQLLISVTLLSIPSVFFWNALRPLSEGSEKMDNFSIYSIIVAVLILGSYLMSYVLQLGTHRSFFIKPKQKESDHTSGNSTSFVKIILMLIVITIAMALVSNHLVDALEYLVKGSHLTPLLVGMFILPLFSAIPEAIVSIRAATNGRMDIAMTSTVESSVQLLQFVLPCLVLIGIPLQNYLHLTFPPEALASLFGAALVVQWLTEANSLNWYKGILLLITYSTLITGAVLLK